jgi:uncharacterized delta-60 repeat protein
VRALGAVRQRDGKLVVVGSIGRDSDHDMFVARLYPDGTLDGAFGTGGIQTLNLSQGLEDATAVAIQPDGRLVIAGWTDTERRYRDPLPEMVLARLRPDGSFDEGFGDRGVVRFPSPADCVRTSAATVAVRSDGTILMGGNTGATCPRPDGAFWPVIARVPPDGNGATVLELHPFSYVYLSEMALDGETGRLYLGGTISDDVYGATRMWAGALGPDLTPDRSFGANGAALADFPGTIDESASSIILDGRGRVVLAGTAGEGGDAARGSPDRSGFGLARFTSVGQLDSGFGRRGLAKVRFRRRFSSARDLLQGPRGQLLVAGVSGRRQGVTRQAVAIARLRPDGKP